MVVDFVEISTAVKELVVDILDHQHLNGIIDNPTCERIVMWIWQTLTPALPQLDSVRLWETTTSSAMLQRGDKLTGSRV